jgi:hypothetical protein
VGEFRSPPSRDLRAKAIQKVPAQAPKQVNEAKFDNINRLMTKSDAENDLDALDSAQKELDGLAENLRILMELLEQDETRLNMELTEKRARLLEEQAQ